MKFYMFLDKETGLYYVNRWWNKTWDKKPRLYRNIGALRSSLYTLSARTLNPEWYAKFIEENPRPIIISEGGTATAEEAFKWSRHFHESWYTFKKENKGLSYITNPRYELKEVEVNIDI